MARRAAADVPASETASASAENSTLGVLLEQLGVELRLRGEVLVDERLGDAVLARDVVDRGRVVAALGEHRERGIEDRGAPLFAGQALAGGGAHLRGFGCGAVPATICERPHRSLTECSVSLLPGNLRVNREASLVRSVVHEHDNLRGTGDGSRARRRRRAGEAIGATAAAGVATALIALLIAWHRSGRIDWLARAAAAARRATGLPEWAALPVLVLNASLLTAVLGMYWDISLHIDNGRDPGPLANPAHYLILVGPVRRAARRRAERRAGRGAPEPHGDLARRRLVGPGRRRADRRLRRVRAVGLPAGRPLAPAVRPGRHALGPDPPDADRRRLAGDARRDGAPVRGDRRARARPGARAAGARSS